MILVFLNGNFKYSVTFRVRFIGLGLGLGLVLVLVLITLKRLIFNRTQLKLNQDFENNIWRHLLNIIIKNIHRTIIGRLGYARITWILTYLDV